MRSIESEGDTIDEAIDAALATLELSRDRVEIEILNDAARGGLFGFGSKRARVRATERGSLWSSRESRPMPEVSRETSVVADTRTPESPVSRETTGTERPVEGTPRDEPTQRPGRLDRGEEGGRRRGAPRAPSQTPRSDERGDAEPRQIGADLEGRAKALLADILTRMGVPCSVTAAPGPEAGVVVLEITGESSGLLIGRRGQTLDALEYMVNRVVGRGREADAAAERVMIDVERYRERRREYLETLGKRLARKASDSGRVVTLNPMSPRDRRIVHLTLQDHPHVTTHSQGEGHYRQVLIVPAEAANRGTRQPRRAD
jgi:spoIIIJ-associated protein